MNRVFSKVLFYSTVYQVEQDIPIWNNNKIFGKQPALSEDGPIPRFRRWYQQFYSPSSDKVWREKQMKRTLFAAAVAMAMCMPVYGQDGITHDNINKNMQDMHHPKKDVQDNSMTNRSMTTTSWMRSYDQNDINNWSDHSMWWKDAMKELNHRDQAVLLMAIRRLPGSEEMTLRKAVQNCHIGNEKMFTSERMSKYHDMMRESMNQSENMRTRKVVVSSTDIWNNTVESMTAYERARMAWTWEQMQPSEREALMNLLRSCHDHHLWSRSSNH